MNLLQVRVDPIFKKPDDLIDSLIKKTGCSINPWSMSVIKNAVTEVSSEERFVNLTLVAPRDIGFKGFTPKNCFFECVKSRGFNNHSVEMYLRYVLQNHGQIRENSFLLFAMDPVQAFDNTPHILGVCRLCGDLIIFCSSVSKDVAFHSEREWLF
jgi:hypothetical protein